MGSISAQTLNEFGGGISDISLNYSSCALQSISL